MYVWSSLSIFSPTFLTNIFSPSFTNFISVIGTNSDNTPVILNSIFLLKSPFSYPNIVSVDLKSSADDILEVTPEQPKNWLMDLDVYSIVLSPLTIVPVVPNPTVESTSIIVAPVVTGFNTFVLPGIVNVPSIKSRSLNPTNNEIL